MATLQALIVVLFCGNTGAFLVDDQDAGDVYLNAVEELTFSTVATSDSILFPSGNINGRQCENEMIGWCSLANDTKAAVHIFFSGARVVDTLTFDSTSIDCTRVPSSDMEKFTLQYLDPEDQTNQFRTYDVNISGPLLGDQGRTVYNLNPTIYTRVLKIIPNKPGTCFALKISGANGTGLCPGNHTCQNGGQCSGVNQCSCPKGFMGQMCETQVTMESIEIDNFEFLKMTDGVIETPTANFTATGNVTLQSAERRRFPWLHRCWFHGPHAAIHTPLGHGHWGLGHSHVHGHGHDHGHGSLWQHINPFHGFSHSLHVSFGHRHDHHHTSCLFQYHPHFANGVRASCNYARHFLHYFVHHGTHLFNLKVPFRPTTGHKYEVVLSFSLTHGISLHLNGHLLGSQTKPSIQSPLSASPKPGISIGMCVPPLVGGPVNMAVSGLVSAGLHLAGLAVNGLMHLLTPHIGHPPNVVTKPAQPTTTSQKIITKPTTSSTTASTTATTASTTATTSSTTAMTRAFTNAPVTATSPHSTTVSSNGPLCYSCSHQATDGSCKSVTKCKTSDVCALFQDNNGFTHKCLDQQVCSQAQALIGAGCWKCCSGPLCNDRCSASTKPCTDTPKCALMQGIGYNVCSSTSMANKYCRKTCHIC